MTNQFGSNILKIFSQKGFGFTETRFMEQKGVNCISYGIREAKINALNVGDDQDSMFTFGGGDLALICAGDCSGCRCRHSLQKIALICPSDWPSSEALKQVPHPTWTHVYVSIYIFKADLKSSCLRD